MSRSSDQANAETRATDEQVKQQVVRLREFVASHDKCGTCRYVLACWEKEAERRGLVKP